MNEVEDGAGPMARRLRKIFYGAGIALAAVFFGLTLFNASWIAPSPGGRVKLLAHRGVQQYSAAAGPQNGRCAAARIEQPYHRFLENTLASVKEARALGSAMIQLDIAATSDGRLVVFRDSQLECRTDGTGTTRDHTLAQLRALDAGYGYSADGGKSFPFRGKGLGAIPALEDFLTAVGNRPLLFTFTSRNPGEADLLAAALKAAGRDVEAIGDGFYSETEAGPVARIRAIYPRAWVFSRQSAAACSDAYMMQGWLGIVPEACHGGTLIVPLDRQWPIAGWPNRTIARMDSVGARIIIIGPQGGEGRPLGIDLPEQLGEVPASFNGHLWVEDMWTISPALFPSADNRTGSEVAAAEQALSRRRAAR